MTFVAILVPWLSFFLRGRIFTGIICLLLQLTIIGWIPLQSGLLFHLMMQEPTGVQKKLSRLLNKAADRYFNFTASISRWY